MSSNNLDHSEQRQRDPGSQSDTSKTDSDEADLPESELLRWLPLLAANDFLE